jgi:hypothetical protein
MTERKTPDVGYMNPPKQTQFKKGKSGNPRGRPRKHKDLNTVLQQVLNRKIRIKDDERKMPLRDALIWKLRELALQGDKQALALQRRIIDESGIADPNAYSPEEEKQRMIRALVAMGAKVVKSKGDS